MVDLTKIAVEGDFVESNNILFAVKGTVHPTSYIIAYPKYILNEKGGRETGQKRYMKIDSLSNSIKYLKENFSQYLRFDPVFNQTLCEIPASSIKKIYRSKDTYQRLKGKATLDVAETDAISLVKLLHEKSQIPHSSIGISGSIMLELHIETSDIDLIVYGKEQSLKVYETLKSLDKEGVIHRYSKIDLKKLFNFRIKDTHMEFDLFAEIEGRKLLQGKFREREYFIRLLKMPDESGEKYGDTHYLPIKTIELRAEIEDSSESFFTPCTYSLKTHSNNKYAKNTDIREVVSYRGRFCEQVKTGDEVLIRGKLEKVTSANGEYFRVVVGGSREDVLIPLNSR